MAKQQHTVSHQRLQQTLQHIEYHETQLSIAHGPSSPPLRSIILPDLLDEQCVLHGSDLSIIVPWTGARWTYNHLREQSISLAKSLLQLGIEKGDRIGILADNCEQYAAILFAAGYIGAILVVLNGTYTEEEAKYALSHSGCRSLFMTPTIGRTDNRNLLQGLGPRPSGNGIFELLEHVFVIREAVDGFNTYENLAAEGSNLPYEALDKRRANLNTFDVCNLQYTSGSTGNPKAAMLTHHNLLNNSFSIGSRLGFSPSTILCCPPPLFHCFGLVLGLLATLSHGGRIVFPSPTFDAKATLQAVVDGDCTALHGVPAMFEDVLRVRDEWKRGGKNVKTLQLSTGIIAGSPVPRPLMERLVGELGMKGFASSYGLTEASPTTYLAYPSSSINSRLTTVGSLLPHITAKIVNPSTGRTVPLGQRGEILISGYSLQKGYWENEEKTREAMIWEGGQQWLRTGDEGVFVFEDGEMRARITGRFKDIIIRGGENIYPIEIEERLQAHPCISRAIVVGLSDPKLVEVVGTFLEFDNFSESRRPTDNELRAWVREKLGRHKAPEYVFWFGDQEVGNEIPMTGSGKIKKHVLRRLGDGILKSKKERVEVREEIAGARC